MSYLMRGDRNNGALFIYASANKKLSPIVKVPYIDARRSLVKLGILGAQLPFAGMPPAGGRRV